MCSYLSLGLALLAASAGIAVAMVACVLIWAVFSEHS